MFSVIQGAGKSTLAKKLSAKYSLVYLDLDGLAWLDTNPPERKLIEDSRIIINRFLNKHAKWVVEGCYSDLLSIVIQQADKVVFLNPGIEVCIENCKKRQCEPHKYASMNEQNENLDMLIEWVKDCPIRRDEFSYESYYQLFKAFSGDKEEHVLNISKAL